MKRSGKNSGAWALTGAGVIGALLAAIPLAAAGEPERWYTRAQVERGAKIYAANCLVCHGTEGRGAENWKQPDANGKYPPPPLNGAAHTWHHSLAALRRTVHTGGVKYGGQMPAFEGVLSAEEIDSVLAYVQDLWSDKIYETWETHFGAK